MNRLRTLTLGRLGMNVGLDSLDSTREALSFEGWRIRGDIQEEGSGFVCIH